MNHKYQHYIHGLPIFLLVISVFTLSLLVSPYYIAGDQFHYRGVYEGLKNLNLTNGFILYISSLDSKEVMHFFFSWLASNLSLDKDLFTATSNAFLAYVVVVLLRKWQVSFFIIGLLLLTNFYFYVLYFSAERLKFGFIFLMLSILHTRRFYVFAFLSIISHVQVLVIYGSILFEVLSSQFVRLVTAVKVKLTLIISVIFFLVLWFFLGEHLLSKFHYYYGEHGFSDLWRMFCFFILSLWYSKNKKQVVFIFIPMFMAVYLIGGERLNMMGYFIFLYYALPVKRGFNLGVLVTFAYFMFTSIGFIGNVLEYGDAFYEN